MIEILRYLFISDRHWTLLQESKLIPQLRILDVNELYFLVSKGHQSINE